MPWHAWTRHSPYAIPGSGPVVEVGLASTLLHKIHSSIPPQTRVWNKQFSQRQPTGKEHHHHLASRIWIGIATLSSLPFQPSREILGLKCLDARSPLSQLSLLSRLASGLMCQSHRLTSRYHTTRRTSVVSIRLVLHRPLVSPR